MQHKEASEALAATRSKRLEEEGHLSSSRQQVREVEQEADVVRDRIDRMERYVQALHTFFLCAVWFSVHCHSAVKQ